MARRTGRLVIITSDISLTETSMEAEGCVQCKVRIGRRLCCEKESRQIVRCLEELSFYRSCEIDRDAQQCVVSLKMETGEEVQKMLAALNDEAHMEATLAVEEESEVVVEEVEDVEVGESDEVVKTRLGVANVCCELESQLIKQILEPLRGVEDVKVNVIGRVAYVSHRSGLAATELVDALNAKRLGASLASESVAASGGAASGGPRTLPCASVCGLVVAFVVLSALYYSGTPHAMAYEIALLVMATAGAAVVLGKAALSVALRRQIDVHTLMLLAYVGSLTLGEYVEAAAVVVAFAVAQYMEVHYMRRVRRALAEIVRFDGATSACGVDGRVLRLEDLVPGDLVAVRAGDRAPADGVVRSGRASLEESCLTGEAAPVEKEEGDGIVAGSLCVAGYVEVEVTAVVGESALGRMRAMVDEAQATRSPTQELVAKFATYFMPASLLAATLVFLIPIALGSRPDVWLHNALVVLIVACPCALVVAAPIAVVSAVAAAAKRGVVIKNGGALEALAMTNLVFTDKTGTLTQGRCRVVDFRETHKDSRAVVARLAAAVETRSTHPLATAVVNFAMGDCCASAADEALSEDVKDYEVVAGQGVRATVDGRSVAVGNAQLVGMPDATDTTNSSSATTVYVQVDGVVHLALDVADPVRPEASTALTRLGAEVVMLTGDKEGPARAVAEQLQIPMKVESGLVPDDKLGFVRRAQDAGRVVLMIGDGLNDAPALKLANVGAALGAGGTALAVDAADVAVMNDDLDKLADAKHLAIFTRCLIAQNVALAVFLKFAILAAFFAGHAQLWMAILGDLLSLFLVVANGLRPLSYFPSVSDAYQPLPSDLDDLDP